MNGLVPAKSSGPRHARDPVHDPRVDAYPVPVAVPELEPTMKDYAHATRTVDADAAGAGRKLCVPCARARGLREAHRVRSNPLLEAVRTALSPKTVTRCVHVAAPRVPARTDESSVGSENEGR
jgi:hypothetical protein